MSFELILPFFRPIADLLLDEEISEIMGNPDGTWWVEREGEIAAVNGVDFSGDKLRTGLDVIAKKLQKKLDTENPLLNARLPDGSRLAAAIPPVVKPGPLVNIRKFNSRNFTIEDLIARGTLPGSLASELAKRIALGQNMLISGSTSSGKSTLLNVLSNYIPERERIVIIEDISELNFRKPHVISAECQADSYRSTVSFDELLRGALRWRPDRIILGEVRGSEARILLDSLNTGHRGSLATIHADSAARALRRLATLAMRGHQQARRDETEAEVAESVRIVVHTARDGSRRHIREVVEVVGYNRASGQFELRSLYTVAESPAVLGVNTVLATARLIPAAATALWQQGLAADGIGTGGVGRCSAPDEVLTRQP